MKGFVAVDEAVDQVGYFIEMAKDAMEDVTSALDEMEAEMESSRYDEDELGSTNVERLTASRFSDHLKDLGCVAPSVFVSAGKVTLYVADLERLFRELGFA